MVKKAVVAKVKGKAKKEVAPEPVKSGRSTVRDKKLFPTVNENPFKRGWSKDSWEKIVAEPGKTFRQYLDEGGRSQSIAHAVKQGWLRTE